MIHSNHPKESYSKKKRQTSQIQKTEMNKKFCKHNVFVMEDYDVLLGEGKYTSYCIRGRNVRQCPYFKGGDLCNCKTFSMTMNEPEVFKSHEDVEAFSGKEIK